MLPSEVLRAVKRKKQTQPPQVLCSLGVSTHASAVVQHLRKVDDLLVFRGAASSVLSVSLKLQLVSLCLFSSGSLQFQAQSLPTVYYINIQEAMMQGTEQLIELPKEIISDTVEQIHNPICALCVHP